MANSNSISQFSAADLKEKHNAQLQKRENLADQRMKRAVTASLAELEAMRVYQANPTKRNYRNWSTAVVRKLQAIS